MTGPIGPMCEQCGSETGYAMKCEICGGDRVIAKPTDFVQLNIWHEGYRVQTDVTIRRDAGNKRYIEVRQNGQLIAVRALTDLELKWIREAARP